MRLQRTLRRIVTAGAVVVAEGVALVGPASASTDAGTIRPTWTGDWYEVSA